MKKIYTLFFLLCCVKIYATTHAYLDSVQNVLNTTTKSSEKLNCLYILSFESGLTDPEKGIEFGKKCLNLAVHENNLQFQLNAYNGIANAYETLANFDSALYFHLQSYEIAKRMKSSQKMALTIVNVALCYKQKGDYKSALNQYLIAYKLLENQPSYNPRIHFYIGEIYMRLGDYSNAEYQSRLGVKKCKEFKHDYVIYNLYVNLAKCYQHSGKIDSAIFILSDALKGLEQNTDNFSIGLCLNALGEAYLAKKEYKKAFDFFAKELIIQKKLGNENGICLSYLNMAYCLSLQQNNKTGVISFLKESEKLMNGIKQNSDALLEIYYKRAEIYELIGDNKNALTNYKLYFALNNIVLNKGMRNRLLELQTKYDTDKKENQIKALKQFATIRMLEIKAKNEQIKFRNITIVLIITSLLFILIYFYNYFQQQRLKNIIEKESVIKTTEEKERIRMAKDIHDDLGSGLSKIKFLSEILFKKSRGDEELSNASTGISETATHLVNNMKDLIWALNPENTTLPNLVARIREYSYDYLDEFGAEVIIHFPEHIPNKAVSKEFHREIFMVVKECLNNIVKHSKASLVTISLTIVQNKIQFVIVDNGVGIKEERSGSGNGLRNIKNRIQSIKGSLIVNSDPGTTIIFNAPIE